MPDILRVVESAIEARLKWYLRDKGCAIAAFPDNAAKFGRATPRGQILVGYRSSSFKAIAEQPITMEMQANFEVLVQLQNLRTHTGAYQLLDWIRFALTGFIAIAGPTKGMRPSNEKIDDLDDNGNWIYSQSWTVPLTITAGFDGYAPLPTPDPTIPESQILDPPPYIVTAITSGVWRNQIGEKPDSNLAELDREWGDVIR